MILRRAGHLALFSLITQSANIVMYMVLARYITVEYFATLRQLFLIQSIIIGVLVSSLPSALLYFSGMQEHQLDSKRYANSIIWIVVAMAFILTCGIWFLSPLISDIFSNPNLEYLLNWFCLATSGFIALCIVPAYLVTIKKTKVAPWLSIILAMSMNCPVILIAYMGASLETIIKVIALVYFIFGLGLLVWMLLDTKTDKRQSAFAFLKSIIRYVAPLALATTVAVIGLKLDHVIVSAMLGVSMYALYSVGAFEIPIFSVIQNSITSSLLPEISKDISQGKFKEAQSLWGKTNRKVAWVTFPIAIFLIYFSEYVIWGLFGEKYINAAPVFTIFTLLVFVRVMNFGLVLRATGATHLELYAHLVFVIVSLLLAYMLTELFGVIGAAYGVFISTLILCFLMLVFSRSLKNCNIDLVSVYPWKELGLATIALVLLYFFPLPRIVV